MLVFFAARSIDEKANERALRELYHVKQKAACKRVPYLNSQVCFFVSAHTTLNSPIAEGLDPEANNECGEAKRPGYVKEESLVLVDLVA